MWQAYDRKLREGPAHAEAAARGQAGGNGSTSNAALPCAGSSWTQEQPAAPGETARGQAGDEAQEGGGDEEGEAAEGAGQAAGDLGSVLETLEGGAPSDTAMVGTALRLPAQYSLQAVKYMQRATYCGAYWLTPPGAAVTQRWHVQESALGGEQGQPGTVATGQVRTARCCGVFAVPCVRF